MSTAPQLVPVQLDSVFAEARRAVAPALNGCILTMQSNGLTVQGDADLLCDLVINLVTNAAKASTPGSAIAVCAEQADGPIRLTVQDHGQGIPADKLARVVEPFYMVDKSRSRPPGRQRPGSGPVQSHCPGPRRNACHGKRAWQRHHRNRHPARTEPNRRRTRTGGTRMKTTKRGKR